MTVQTLVNKTQNTILSAAFIISASSGIGALLGVIKNRLLAHHFGVSKELAIFYTSDYIPGLLYSVLIVGAVSTVFIPIFSSLLKIDKNTAYKTASSIINSVLILFLCLGSVIIVFSPQIFNLISLNKFTETDASLGSNLMRIMTVSQMLLVAGSLTTSILQSYKYFLIPALAPIVYNIGMIMGIIILSPVFGIYGPAVGVLFGAAMHFIIQIPILKNTGFIYLLDIDIKDSNFNKMMSLIPSRIGSVLIANLIQTINNSLAIFISSASVITLKFANQLQGFPVALFGFSIASASLPTLSSEGENKDLSSFKKTLITSFHQMMFLVMPLSMILFILRVPVVRLVYGVSNFPWEATLETASVLSIFSFSIFAQSANYLLTRSFYALKDTKTPLILSIATSALNIAISLLLIKVFKFGIWSVAFSYSVTSILDTVILLYLLGTKTGGIETSNIFNPFAKISISTLLMGLTLYIPIKLLDQVIFDTTRTINLLILTSIAGICGVITYLLFTKIFKVEEIELLYKILRKLKITKDSAGTEISPVTETPAE